MMSFRCATWRVDSFRRGPRYSPVSCGYRSTRGVARSVEWHAGVVHPRRVQLLTMLAVQGPCTTMDLARELEWEAGHLGIVLRGMADGFLVEAQEVPRRGGRWGEGRWGREWSITDTGRWSLWRLAVLTLHTLWDPFDPWIPVEGVPDDPVEAVGTYVLGPLLSPIGLVVAHRILGLEPTSMRSVALDLDLAMGHVSQRVRAWHRMGWLEACEESTVPFQGKTYPLWRFSDAGVAALYRHVDALRRAGLACGWEPTPGNFTYGEEPLPECRIEEDFLRCGMRL